LFDLTGEGTGYAFVARWNLTKIKAAQARLKYGKIVVNNRETNMRKLCLLAVSAGVAAVCVAIPVSPNWSPAKTGLFTQDRAEAVVVVRRRPVAVVRRPVVVHRRVVRPVVVR
jgi:hypothetical protein